MVAKKNRPSVLEGRSHIKNKQDYMGVANIVLLMCLTKISYLCFKMQIYFRFIVHSLLQNTVFS